MTAKRSDHYREVLSEFNDQIRKLEKKLEKDASNDDAHLKGLNEFTQVISQVRLHEDATEAETAMLSIPAATIEHRNGDKNTQSAERELRIGIRILTDKYAQKLTKLEGAYDRLKIKNPTPSTQEREYLDYVGRVLGFAIEDYRQETSKLFPG